MSVEGRLETIKHGSKRPTVDEDDEDEDFDDRTDDDDEK
jgi:hypothetical protein